MKQHHPLGLSRQGGRTYKRQAANNCCRRADALNLGHGSSSEQPSRRLPWPEEQYRLEASASGQKQTLRAAIRDECFTTESCPCTSALPPLGRRTAIGKSGGYTSEPSTFRSSAFSPRRFFRGAVDTGLDSVGASFKTVLRRRILPSSKRRSFAPPCRRLRGMMP